MSANDAGIEGESKAEISSMKHFHALTVINTRLVFTALWAADQLLEEVITGFFN
jgi:hypothetical protein